MNGFRFAVAASALVVAVSLVARVDGTPQSQSVEIQLQLGEMLFGEGKYQESLEAYRNAVNVGAAGPDATGPRRRHQVGASRRGVRKRPGRGRKADPGKSPRLGIARALRRRAVGFGPVRAGRGEVPRSAGGHPRAGPRLPRHGTLARRAQPARAGDGPGAGRPASRPPRPRDSSHRRRDLRALPQVRGSRRCVLQLRQPAAEQRHQLQGQLVAQPDPVPALVRATGAVRGGSRLRTRDCSRSRSSW